MFYIDHSLNSSISIFNIELSIIRKKNKLQGYSVQNTEYSQQTLNRV